MDTEAGAGASRISLGQAYTARGQADEALRVYEKALMIDENNADVHFQMGNLHAEVRRDLAAAEAAYMRVAELNPQHLDAMKKLVSVLMQKDEPARAVAVLNNLIEVAPETKPLREQFLAEHQARVDAAPDDVKARFTLGVLYLELNQHDKAIEQFQKTRPFKTFTLKSYNMLGLAFSRKAGYNSDDLAIKQFRKGLELGPGYPEAGHQRACAGTWGSCWSAKRQARAKPWTSTKRFHPTVRPSFQSELSRRMRALQDDARQGPACDRGGLFDGPGGRQKVERGNSQRCRTTTSIG